jgi:hypothetical protein
MAPADERRQVGLQRVWVAYMSERISGCFQGASARIAAQLRLEPEERCKPFARTIDVAKKYVNPAGGTR